MIFFLLYIHFWFLLRKWHYCAAIYVQHRCQLIRSASHTERLLTSTHINFGGESGIIIAYFIIYHHLTYSNRKTRYTWAKWTISLCFGLCQLSECTIWLAWLSGVARLCQTVLSSSIFSKMKKLALTCLVMSFLTCIKYNICNSSGWSKGSHG